MQKLIFFTFSLFCSIFILSCNLGGGKDFHSYKDDSQAKSQQKNHLDGQGLISKEIFVQKDNRTGFPFSPIMLLIHKDDGKGGTGYNQVVIEQFDSQGKVSIVNVDIQAGPNGNTFSFEDPNTNATVTMASPGILKPLALQQALTLNLTATSEDKKIGQKTVQADFVGTLSTTYVPSSDLLPSSNVLTKLITLSDSTGGFQFPNTILLVATDPKKQTFNAAVLGSYNSKGVGQINTVPITMASDNNSFTYTDPSTSMKVTITSSVVGLPINLGTQTKVFLTAIAKDNNGKVVNEEKQMVSVWGEKKTTFIPKNKIIPNAYNSKLIDFGTQYSLGNAGLPDGLLLIDQSTPGSYDQLVVGYIDNQGQPATKNIPVTIAKDGNSFRYQDPHSGNHFIFSFPHIATNIEVGQTESIQVNIKTFNPNYMLLADGTITVTIKGQKPQTFSPKPAVLSYLPKLVTLTSIKKMSDAPDKHYDFPKQFILLPNKTNNGYSVIVVKTDDNSYQGHIQYVSDSAIVFDSTLIYMDENTPGYVTKTTSKGQSVWERNEFKFNIPNLGDQISKMTNYSVPGKVDYEDYSGNKVLASEDVVAHISYISSYPSSSQIKAMTEANEKFENMKSIRTPYGAPQAYYIRYADPSNPSNTLLSFVLAGLGVIALNQPTVDQHSPGPTKEEFDTMVDLQMHGYDMGSLNQDPMPRVNWIFRPKVWNSGAILDQYIIAPILAFPNYNKDNKTQFEFTISGSKFSAWLSKYFNYTHQYPATMNLIAINHV